MKNKQTTVGLQHLEQPVETGHRHGEAGGPAETGGAAHRLIFQRDHQRRERDERKRPEIDPREREKIEESGPYRERVGEPRRDQWRPLTRCV
jgi:hypothetical protein